MGEGEGTRHALNIKNMTIITHKSGSKLDGMLNR